MEIDLSERGAGVLLGLACGDALGAPAEFLTAEQVRQRYGRLTHFLPQKKLPAASYTDDAEMALALAESILEVGGVDAVRCAKSYARRCFMTPRRGYGPNTLRKLTAVLAGADPRTTGDQADGNGAVTRIAPLAIFHSVCGRVGGLHNQIEAALLCTHRHPDAVRAARYLCDLISCLMRNHPKESKNWAVEFALHASGRWFEVSKPNSISWLVSSGVASEQDAKDRLIRPNQFGRHFAIRAVDCVAMAVYYFLAHDDPERAVTAAASAGGDADSVACVTGALCGAAHGTGWIPRRWLDNLEDCGLFRDAGERLARP